MAQATLEGIHRRFSGNVVALDDLNLNIRAGELLAVVGPSGCGKTTMLRILAGLDRPDAGAIRIGDATMNGSRRIRPIDRGIAMVLQDAAMYPHMTVRRNLDFVLKQHGFPADRRGPSIEETASLVDITSLLDRRPGDLSGGQAQRAALARSLIIRPRLLLLDEPLNHLDRPIRQRLCQEIRRLQRHLRITTVYVTHDHAEALAMGDRVAVMHRGQIEQVGSPHDIYERPANRFVASFFGDPAMNLLHGRAEQVGDLFRFQLQGGATVEWHAVPLPANESEVVLGVRPHDISIGDAVAAPLATWPKFTITIESIVWLGERVLLHGRTIDGQRLDVALPGRASIPGPGRTVVVMNPEAVHFFAADDTGRSLMVRG